MSATLAPGAAATYRLRAPERMAPAGDLGWVDLDYGRGPAGTPTGRLTASVGPEVIAAMSQVKLGDRWLAYALPYGAELKRAGPATDLAGPAGGDGRRGDADRRTTRWRT